MVPNTLFNSYFTPRNGEPIIPSYSSPTTGSATPLRVNVPDIHSLAPITAIIDHKRIKFLTFDGIFKGTLLVSFNLTHFQCIGLAHNDKDLNGFGHVCRLAV